MAREEIKRLAEGAKGAVDAEYEGFARSLHEELESCKKKSLDRIG